MFDKPTQKKIKNSPIILHNMANNDTIGL